MQLKGKNRRNGLNLRLEQNRKALISESQEQNKSMVP